jgi:hypothetical protein
MEMLNNDVLSSIMYLLIWISFWGIIDTLIIKYTKNNMNSKLVIYIIILLLSCVFYIFVLNKNINITRLNSQNQNKKNDETITSPATF